MKDHSGNTVMRPTFTAWVNGLGLAAAILITLLGAALSAQASPRVRQEGLTSRDGRVQFAVDAGELHVCAVRNDGTVRCWGYNADGQLGDGTQTDRLTPVTVSGTTTAVTVSAGIFHTCAVLVGGTARHRVLLTAVVNCAVDHKVTVEMTLTQDEVTGHGQAVGKCRGGLIEYPVEVSVRQGAPFELGRARAEIIATVREGHKVVDVQEWQRAVEIDPAP